MKIRDGHATLNGDKTEHAMPSGSLDIIADDGRALFKITMEKDGSILVSAGHVCKHQKVVLDDMLHVLPKSSNLIKLQRPKYQE